MRRRVNSIATVRPTGREFQRQLTLTKRDSFRRRNAMARAEATHTVYLFGFLEISADVASLIHKSKFSRIHDQSTEKISHKISLYAAKQLLIMRSFNQTAENHRRKNINAVEKIREQVNMLETLRFYYYYFLFLFPIYFYILSYQVFLSSLHIKFSYIYHLIRQNIGLDNK